MGSTCQRLVTIRPGFLQIPGALVVLRELRVSIGDGRRIRREFL